MKMSEILKALDRARDALERIDTLLSIPYAAASGSLPSGWRRVRIGDVGESIIGPFGSHLKMSDYRDKGVTPIVFVADVRAETFGGPGTHYVTATKAKELSSNMVQPGDLLVTKMGKPPGDTAVYPAGRPPGIITSDIIRITPDRAVTSSEYLRLIIRSADVRAQVLARTRGDSHRKVSLERFREIRVPMPSLEEQARFIEWAGARIAVLDRLAALIEWAPARARKNGLEGAILRYGIESPRR